MNTTTNNEPSGRDTILKIIGEHQHLVDDWNGPFELTQDGIAARMGRTRSHVSGDMRVLVRSGRAVCVYRVVKGARSKRKVYVLPGHSAVRGIEHGTTLESLARDVRATNERLDRIIGLLSVRNPNNNIKRNE